MKNILLGLQRFRPSTGLYSCLSASKKVRVSWQFSWHIDATRNSQPGFNFLTLSIFYYVLPETAFHA